MVATCAALSLGVLFALGGATLPARAAERPAVRRAASCEPSMPLCVGVNLVFGMAVSPDGRNLYALSWEPGEQQVHRLVGWAIGGADELEYSSPVAASSSRRASHTPAACLCAAGRRCVG